MPAGNKKSIASRSAASQGRIVPLAGLVVCVAAATAAVHWPVLSAQALFLDDHEYLVNNALVQHPGWESAGRFFGEVLRPSTVGGYYQPLAMVSLMLDCAMGGRPGDAWAFHRTSLVLHIVNTSLIIVLVYLLFDAPWIAAAAGLLFGIHPMTVEPVAWIAERKTLLAACFSLGCLIVYVAWTRVDGRLFAAKSRVMYAVCVVLFACALLSKPTSTPLPLLMLLLDVWPLRRLSLKAVREKIPLFAMAIGGAIVTFISQSRTASVEMPVDYGPMRIPLVLCHNNIFYLWKFIWPIHAGGYYMFPEPLALTQPVVWIGVVGTSLLLALLVASWRWTAAPMVGLLFFFAAILPTMQIVGFTKVIAADKYVYLPAVGLSLIFAWLAQTASRRPGIAAPVFAAVLLVVALAESFSTRRCLAAWNDSVTHYRRLLVDSPGAATLHHQLAVSFSEQGRVEEAIREYEEAIRLQPTYWMPYNNLATIFSARREWDRAIECYQTLMRLQQDQPQVANNLANLLAQRGRMAEAAAIFEKIVRLHPEMIRTRLNLGLAYQKLGRLAEAANQYRAVLQMEPANPEARARLETVEKSR